jgi:hypothetical protein
MQMAQNQVSLGQPNEIQFSWKDLAAMSERKNQLHFQVSLIFLLNTIFSTSNFLPIGYFGDDVILPSHLILP